MTSLHHWAPAHTVRKGRVAKRSAGGRIIRTFVRAGRVWEFHATKGWRTYRV